MASIGRSAGDTLSGEQQKLFRADTQLAFVWSVQIAGYLPVPHVVEAARISRTGANLWLKPRLRKWNAI